MTTYRFRREKQICRTTKDTTSYSSLQLSRTRRAAPSSDTRVKNQKLTEYPKENDRFWQTSERGEKFPSTFFKRKRRFRWCPWRTPIEYEQFHILSRRGSYLTETNSIYDDVRRPTVHDVGDPAILSLTTDNLTRDPGSYYSDDPSLRQRSITETNANDSSNLITIRKSTAFRGGRGKVLQSNHMSDLLSSDRKIIETCQHKIRRDLERIDKLTSPLSDFLMDYVDSTDIRFASNFRAYVRTRSLSEYPNLSNTNGTRETRRDLSIQKLKWEEWSRTLKQTSRHRRTWDDSEVRIPFALRTSAKHTNDGVIVMDDKMFLISRQERIFLKGILLT